MAVVAYFGILATFTVIVLGIYYTLRAVKII